MGLAVAAGYLLGTFPTADLVAKRASGGDVDLRSTGSGNPGGANALAVLGTAAGLQVLAGDIAKGAAACGIGGLVAGPAGAHLAGTAAVAGHCHPVWNGFDGGKGVATSVGQCLATFPAYFPIDVAVAAGTASIPALQQRSSTATAVSSCCWVLGGWLWSARGWRNAWGPAPSPLLPLSALASSVLIARRFRAAAARTADRGSTRRACDDDGDGPGAAIESSPASAIGSSPEMPTVGVTT